MDLITKLDDERLGWEISASNDHRFLSRMVREYRDSLRAALEEKDNEIARHMWTVQIKEEKCDALRSRIANLESENRRLMQSNLELLDEQKTMKRDLWLYGKYLKNRGVHVADLIVGESDRRAGKEEG